MNYSNNAYSVLDGAIGAADTVIQVAVGSGARFPASDFMVTLVGHDISGNESARSASVEAAVEATRTFAVRGPFPHPITDHARFAIDLPSGVTAASVRLRIYDASNREIRRVEGAEAEGPGSAVLTWDRRDGSGRMAAPGFYLARIEAGDRVISRRIYAAPY